METDFFCSSCADGNTRRQVISALRARINQSNRLLMARQVLASGSPEFQQVQASGCVMSVCECPAHKLILKAASYSVVRSVSCSCSLKFSLFFLVSCASCICPQSTRGSKAMSDNAGDSGTLDKRGIPQHYTSGHPPPMIFMCRSVVLLSFSL